MNLVSGFIAIIFAANGNLITASWFILAAMIFDFLDGFSARLLKAYSPLGKELDSLADVVSFGVAPGIIMYNLLLNTQITKSSELLKTGDPVAYLFIVIPALIPVFGALRLAIFNLDETQATSFKGLPIPANALAVISLVISSHFSQSPLITALLGSPVFLILYTIVLSLLMVSRIPLFSLKVKNLKLKGNEGRLILLGLILICALFFGVLAIPLIIPLYLISSGLALLF
jgi:CDP-diacylglycerol---serine O-phosphatidyltransferase